MMTSAYTRHHILHPPNTPPRDWDEVERERAKKPKKGEKRCSNCGKVKSVEEFFKEYKDNEEKGRGKLKKLCKVCDVNMELQRRLLNRLKSQGYYKDLKI